MHARLFALVLLAIEMAAFGGGQDGRVISRRAGSISAEAIATARPEDVGFSSERLRAVHSTIQRHIEAGDITGAVTLVASRGRIAHFEAQGLMDLESTTIPCALRRA